MIAVGTIASLLERPGNNKAESITLAVLSYYVFTTFYTCNCKHTHPISGRALGGGAKKLLHYPLSTFLRSEIIINQTKCQLNLLAFTH